MNQFEDTLAYYFFIYSSLGSWVGNEIPWISYWAFLLASAAGTFQDTLLLAIKIANDSGKVHCGLIKNVFDFLITKDDTVPLYISSALKEVFASTNG